MLHLRSSVSLTELILLPPACCSFHTPRQLTTTCPVPRPKHLDPILGFSLPYPIARHQDLLPSYFNISQVRPLCPCPLPTPRPPVHQGPSQCEATSVTSSRPPSGHSCLLPRYSPRIILSNENRLRHFPPIIGRRFPDALRIESTCPNRTFAA